MSFDPSHPARVKAYFALLFRRFQYETVLRKAPLISRRLWRCRLQMDRRIKQAAGRGAKQEVLNLGAA